MWQLSQAALPENTVGFEHVLADASRGTQHSHELNRERIDASTQALKEMRNSAS